MATTEQLSENSHQGFEGIKAALCLAKLEPKPNVASGMQPCLRRNGTGSRCSGKERDVESGLDYFLARYYSGAQGRFTSPDPENAGAIPADPQSWNAYAYARNNPLKFTDPTGTKYRLCNNTGGCIDNYSDADFRRNFQNDAAVTLDYNMGLIYVGGNVIGSFEHLSFDDFTPFQQGLFDAMSAQRTATKGLIASLAAESAAWGVSNFLIGKAIEFGVEAYTAYRSAQVALSDLGGILKGATLLRESRGLSAAAIYEKAGGITQAARDFNSLKGSVAIKGSVRVKTLSDGTKAILRGSTEGRPTLEFQPPAGSITKIRYN